MQLRSKSDLDEWLKDWFVLLNIFRPFAGAVTIDMVNTFAWHGYLLELAQCLKCLVWGASIQRQEWYVWLKKLGFAI